jgi:hypothetical protein
MPPISSCWNCSAPGNVEPSLKSCASCPERGQVRAAAVRGADQYEQAMSDRSGHLVVDGHVGPAGGLDQRFHAAGALHRPWDALERHSG